LAGIFYEDTYSHSYYIMRLVLLLTTYYLLPKYPHNFILFFSFYIMSYSNLSFGKHLKNTLTLSFPVMIGQLGMVLMGVQDNLMVGWVSHVHLSASALANSMYFILIVIGFGVTSAITPLVAEAIGAKKPENTGLFLRQGVWASIFASLGLMLLVEASIWLLPYMGQPAEEVDLAIPYLRILNLSTIPMILFTAYRQFCEGIGDTRTGMVITGIGLLANILFNWMFIFGELGMPRLELTGAAIGTLLARIVMLLIIMAYVHRARTHAPLLAQSTWKIRPNTMLTIFALGLPVGLQFFFEVAAFGGATIMMGWLDNPGTARAAHQIALGTASITFMFCSGLASGAAVRVGNFFGMRNSIEIRRAAMSALLLCVGMMSLCALAFIVLRADIPLWYGLKTGEVMDIAINLCIFAACFQVFDGVQVVAAGILRGRQDVRFATITTFIVHWLVSLPLSYVLAFHYGYGVYGFWISFVVSLGFAAILLSYRVLTLRETFEDTPPVPHNGEPILDEAVV
jgi:multidrug resistance protein, MATE family